MPTLLEIPARPDTGQAASESGGRHRRSGCAVRRALVQVLIETVLDQCCLGAILSWSNKALAHGFQRRSVGSGVPATLRHISVVRSNVRKPMAPIWRLPCVKAVIIG